MAHKVEKFSDIGIDFSLKQPQSRQYLFIDTDPPELWVSDRFGEKHRHVLTATTRNRDNIAAAGHIHNIFGKVEVDGSGSSTIQFPECDPTTVRNMVRDLAGRNVELNWE